MIRKKAILIFSIIIILSMCFVQSGNTQFFTPYPFYNYYNQLAYSNYFNPFLPPVPYRSSALLLPTTLTGGIATPTPGGGILGLLPALTIPTLPVAPIAPVATVAPFVPPTITFTLSIPSLILTLPPTALLGLFPAPVVPAPLPVVTPTLGLTGLTALMGGLSPATLLALGLI